MLGRQFGTQHQLFDPGGAPAPSHKVHARMQREVDSGAGRSGQSLRVSQANDRHGITDGFSPAMQTSGQLKMFMSAREITSQYQPLDADRQESYGGTDSREGSYTGRPYRSDGVTNNPNRPWGPGSLSEQETGKRYTRPSREHEETDDQLWDRKYEEASMSRDEYVEEVHGHEATPRYNRPGGGETARSGTWRSTYSGHTGETYQGHPVKTNTYEPFERSEEGGSSIRESVLQQGVLNPISLGNQFGSVGSTGKPPIVGGHHRIAVMKEHRPDELMPVLHFENIRQAQSKSPHVNPWKYT